MSLKVLRCHFLRPCLLPATSHARSDRRHYAAELDNSPITINLWNKQGTMEIPKKPTLRERMAFTRKHLIPETKKFIKKTKKQITSMPVPDLEHGMYEVAFRFDTPEAISKWQTSGDYVNNQGYSKANFTLSKNRTGLFHGHIDTRVPEDGKTTITGWTNFTAKRPMNPFFRETHYDWSPFNCLLVRFRGDGRAYKLVLGCDFIFDLNWLRRWQFPLYSRGGPYWQVAKIPFSKFYMTTKGRIQDNAQNLPLDLVNTIGITLFDKVDGPFYLEIDSIAVMHDINISGIHAYELYKTKHVVR